MSALIAATMAAGPLVAGWSVHLWWLRRRLESARRDPLTGLWTREGFARRAAVLLRDPRAVVVLADVDHFKHVNDTHGHAAGDALLRATAGRLAHYTGPTGVAGRLGGDEFAAVVIDRHGMADDMLAVLGSVLARPAEGLTRRCTPRSRSVGRGSRTSPARACRSCCAGPMKRCTPPSAPTPV